MYKEGSTSTVIIHSYTMYFKAFRTHTIWLLYIDQTSDVSTVDLIALTVNISTNQNAETKLTNHSFKAVQK